SSFVFAWIIQYPPTSSLDSVNGPSIVLGLPAPKRTRVALAGGVRPSSPSSIPALVRDSLNLVILATRSTGGMKSPFAVSYALGITSSMKRIVVAPWVGVRSRRFRSLPLRRTRGGDIDSGEGRGVAPPAQPPAMAPMTRNGSVPDRT